MNNPRILVLNGHPAAQSLNRTLAQAYADEAARHRAVVQEVHLSDLAFDQDFGRAGYTDVKPLEPDLEELLQRVEWADQIVLTTPMWWGGVPGKLKGLFDRMLLPGRAFDPKKRDPLGMPKPLFVGKCARIVITSDTPDPYFEDYYGSAMIRQLKGQIFNFVGINPVEVTHFAGASHADAGMVDAWTAEMKRLARNAV
ncbi:NAD(P)H dehydrogenase (quinone) [Tateyamaria omphalii]|uniref:NAD(P)H-dependent oxidoreductase n=1 Tax=Tateyamaria omphalii TaxID=299262 RepID=UPI00167B1D68|nr:NAD(P)H-dependent oxidoreductase [Tateyamaria omphalii]GGX60156.1 NAD(P)H dehydrogenase (quinone) [Tateyamaria omphalii]